MTSVVGREPRGGLYCAGGADTAGGAHPGPVGHRTPVSNRRKRGQNHVPSLRLPACFFFNKKYQNRLSKTMSYFKCCIH